jgi:hypothetical protein
MLVIVVSDEPEIDARLDDVLTRLRARHDVMWAMISDMPAVAPGGGDEAGFDVATGRFVLSAATLGRRVVAAYQRAEALRRRQLDEFMTAHAIPYITIVGSHEIRPNLIQLTEVFSRAG